MLTRQYKRGNIDKHATESHERIVLWETDRKWNKKTNTRQ